MTKRTLTLSLLAALALLPGTTLLAQPLQLDGNADCEGWSASATLVFPDAVFSAALDYSVVLADQAGAEIARFDWAGQVNRFENPMMIKMYGEPWGLTLDSVYTASLAFHFLGEEATLAFDVVCGEMGDEGGGEVDPVVDPVVEPCHHTYHFWRKNPDAWPVDELTLGGETFTKDQLVRQLHGHLRVHPSFSVARHLVAAKLNVLSGCDASIQPVIDEADAFLARVDDRPRHWWRHRGDARQLTRVLVQYNNQPCEGVPLSRGGQDLLLDKSYADEPMTFDGMKALYR